MVKSTYVKLNLRWTLSLRFRHLPVPQVGEFGEWLLYRPPTFRAVFIVQLSAKSEKVPGGGYARYFLTYAVLYVVLKGLKVPVRVKGYPAKDFL